MYALIGAGLGMMVYSFVSQSDKILSLSTNSFFMENKGKILMMFANVIIILIGSLTLDNNNRCLNQTSNSLHKILSIIFITLAVILFYLEKLLKKFIQMFIPMLLDVLNPDV